MNATTSVCKANTKTARQPAATATKSLRKALPTKVAAARKTVAQSVTPKRPSAKPIAPMARPAPTAPSGTSKQARLIALLGCAAGASISQMMDLTGWQAHTVRGTISGVLRKRLGLNVACADGDAGVHIYRIVAATSA